MPVQGQSYGVLLNLSAKQSRVAGVGVHRYRRPSVQEPPDAKPAEMEGVQQDACRLPQETADSDGSFWSRGRSLQTHGGGSLRLCNMLFAESHCPNKLLDMVGTAEVEIFVLGRKKEPF